MIRLPLPRVHPNLVSVFSVFTSVLFLLCFLEGLRMLALFFLLFTLLLDWMDGLIAKKYAICSKHGYLVDMISDRLSEGITFIPFIVPWLYLSLLNFVLVFVGIAVSRHVVLPLRQAFVIYFFVEYIVV